MPTTTCPNCHQAFDTGPLYCPHCFMKLPAVMRPRPPAPPRRADRDRDEAVVRRVRAHEPRSARPLKPAASAGQCPACSHPITSKDEWCKWCHWPVNRKT